MNRTQIIDSISETTGLTKKDVNAVLEAQDALINDTLKRGNDFTLGKSGKLAFRHTPARKGRNPQNGQEIDIPAKSSAKFKPSKDLLNFIA